MGVATQAIGLVFALVLAFLSRDAFPAPEAAAWCAAAGIAGVLGLLAFYRGLAVGQMSLVAPVAAVIGAGLPVVAGYAFGDRLAPAQLAGILAALAAVALVSRPADGDEAVRGSGIGLALVAGVGFAGYFVAMDRAYVAGAGTWWPLPVARLASLTLILAAVVVTRRARAIPATISPIVVLSGIADTCGNLGFLLARAQGPLGPAAVVASLYPAGTVMLAWWLLDERLSRVHLVGVAVAFVGIALIASG